MFKRAKKNVSETDFQQFLAENYPIHSMQIKLARRSASILTFLYALLSLTIMGGISWGLMQLAYLTKKTELFGITKYLKENEIKAVQDFLAILPFWTEVICIALTILVTLTAIMAGIQKSLEKRFDAEKWEVFLHIDHSLRKLLQQQNQSVIQPQNLPQEASLLPEAANPNTHPEIPDIRIHNANKIDITPAHIQT